ncbi:porin [Martelella endophytica]|uniref:Porin n=2 Tax=Pseudomonadota TaxID=1224 RepID=A0A0D5LTK5_MAREN|nr:porin [Martelella endophytica]AJY47534.1 hypothetical protein TM49_20645 [Martelella endophytica]
MTLKSLFLGSAAAFVAASGAQAADPVVVIEPTPANYVEVCDVFGAGYFYIPGTETCLNIGGYVRFQVDADDSNWGVLSRGHLGVTAKSDTELGVLTADIEINANAYSDGTNEVVLDNVYLGLGGFQAGYFDTYWDEDLVGEVDQLSGNTKISEMRYAFVGNGFVAGLALDALEPGMVNVYDDQNTDMNKLGVAGRVGFSAGGASAKLDAAYDTYNEEASFRVLSSFALGPGALELAALYNTGANAYAQTWDINSSYYGYTEWAVAAGYQLDVTDKLRITPQVQYSQLKTDNDIGLGDDPDLWNGGVYFEYELVHNFWAKLNVQYTDYNDDLSDAGASDWSGYFRLQRDF